MNTMTHNTRKTVRMILAAAACAALAAGAHADDVVQVHVKYADLNVGTEAGAAELYQRIRHAAIQSCGTADVRDLARAAQVQACTDRAVAAAVARANVPTLTALYGYKMRVNRDRINLAAQ